MSMSRGPNELALELMHLIETEIFPDAFKSSQQVSFDISSFDTGESSGTQIGVSINFSCKDAATTPMLASVLCNLLQYYVIEGSSPVSINLDSDKLAETIEYVKQNKSQLKQIFEQHMNSLLQQPKSSSVIDHYQNECLKYLRTCVSINGVTEEIPRLKAKVIADFMRLKNENKNADEIQAAANKIGTNLRAAMQKLMNKRYEIYQQAYSAYNAAREANKDFSTLYALAKNAWQSAPKDLEAHWEGVINALTPMSKANPKKTLQFASDDTLSNVRFFETPDKSMKAMQHTEACETYLEAWRSYIQRTKAGQVADWQTEITPILRAAKDAQWFAPNDSIRQQWDGIVEDLNVKKLKPEELMKIEYGAAYHDYMDMQKIFTEQEKKGELPDRDAAMKTLLSLAEQAQCFAPDDNARQQWDNLVEQLNEKIKQRKTI